MQKILLGAIIAAQVLLVYPRLMMPQQSVVQNVKVMTSSMTKRQEVKEMLSE
jgi:hypothetical protein